VNVITDMRVYTNFYVIDSKDRYWFASFCVFCVKFVVVALYIEGAFSSSFVSLNLFFRHLFCICDEQMYFMNSYE
jgi:hypothetical protein